MNVLQKEDLIELRDKLMKYCEKAPKFQYTYIMNLSVELENAIDSFKPNDEKTSALYDKINKFLGGN